MNIMLCQVNPTVGDLAGNLSMMKAEITIAIQKNIDVVVFPELVTTGYPPRDLLYRPGFWSEHEKVIAELHRFIRQQLGGHEDKQITVIFGGLHRVELTYGQYAKYNAAFIMDPAQVRVIHKKLRPNYDIFEEERHFAPGDPIRCLPIPIRTNDKHEPIVNCDVLICEDIWNYNFSCDTPWLPASYNFDPVSQLRGTGPLFVINGSPFWRGKVNACMNLVQKICEGIKRPVVYVNQVGGHDDIITHGGSMIALPTEKAHWVTMGDLVAKIQTKSQVFLGKLFSTDRIIPCYKDDIGNNCTNINSGKAKCWTSDWYSSFDDIKMPLWYDKQIARKDFDTWCDFQALRLHVIDYCRRCGFKEVVLGLSGGIDSAVVATIAADALGGENVHGVSMPSKFSSEGSITDAKQLADNLKLGSFQVIPIKKIHDILRGTLLSGGKQQFTNSVTDENLQPRIRANLLMALSNDNNWLLMTTGNKSELAVGYCTLYGDTCGGLSVIGDVYKTDIYRMARCINKYADRAIIPVNTIEKPPSAELAPGQKDTDSLPRYEVLDEILRDLIDHELSRGEMIRKHNVSTVGKIIRLYERSEYKRQQMPVAPKISPRSFGSGRRVPIAAKMTTL